MTSLEFLSIFDQTDSGGLLDPILSWLRIQLDNTTSSNTGLSTYVSHRIQRQNNSNISYFIIGGLIGFVVLCTFVTILIYFVCKLKKENNQDTTDGGNTTKPSSEYQFFKHIKKRFNNRGETTVQRKQSFYDEVDTNFYTSSRQHKHLTNRKIKCQLLATICILTISFVLLCFYLTTSASVLAFLKDDSSNERSVSGMLQQTFHHTETFLTRSVYESNATLIKIFKTNQPEVERLFTRFGKEILDNITREFYLEQLLQSFDNFLGTTKLTMDAMSNISASRKTTIEPLMTFTTILNTRRNDLTKEWNSVCQNYVHIVGLDLCTNVKHQLPNIKIQVNQSKLDVDTSITVTTVIQKMLKLNITQLEQQVSIGRQKLNNSLESISNTTVKLMDNLTNSINAIFSIAAGYIKNIIRSFQNIQNNESLWRTVNTSDALITLLVVITSITFLLVMIISFTISAALIRYFCIREKLRQMRQNNINNQDINDVYNVARVTEVNNNSHSVVNGSMELVEDQVDYSAVNHQHPIRLPVAQHNITVVANQRSPRTFLTRQQKKWTKKEANSFRYICQRDCTLAVIVIGIFATIPLLYSLATYYISGLVYVEGCYYITESHGTEQWDRMINEFMNQSVKPKVDNEINTLPITLQMDHLPNNVFQAIFDQCSNSSVTMFQIFNYMDIVNVADIMHSNFTQKQFNDGLEMVTDVIKSLTIDSIVPKELISENSNLKYILESIAKVLDEQSYDGSVTELNKQLLGLNSQQLTELQNNILEGAQRLANSAETSIESLYLKRYLGALNETIVNNLKKTQASLERLKLNFEQLKQSQIMGNLTNDLLMQLGNVTEQLENKSNMLEKTRSRYQEALGNHIPHFIEFLEPIPEQIMTSIGFCDDLHKASSVVKNSLCSKSLHSIAYGAIYLLALTALLLVLILLSFCILLQIRAKTRSMTNNVNGHIPTPVLSINTNNESITSSSSV